MARLRINSGTLVEKALSHAMRGSEEIDLFECGGEKGTDILIIDMTANDSGAICTFLGSNVFVLGLTWERPESLWLADNAPSLDAMNFKAVRMPFSLGDINDAIRDIHGGWTRIYCHPGMNLWRFTQDALNNKGACGGSNFLRDAVAKAYPAMSPCPGDREMAEKLALHVAFGLHTGLAHRNVEEGLEGFLAGVASFASDIGQGPESTTETEEMARYFLTGLKQHLSELERYFFYLKELAEDKYSDSRSRKLINELKEKHQELYDSLKNLAKLLDPPPKGNLIWQGVVESIKNLKQLLSSRNRIREML